MTRKHTTEEFIRISQIKHGNRYDYSKTKYTTSAGKVIIQCGIHGEFIQKAQNHMRGDGCSRCAGERATLRYSSNKEDFISKAVKVHGHKYSYDLVAYRLARLKVTIICRDHGEFSQEANSHLMGVGCPMCSLDKRKPTGNTQEFMSRSAMVHGDLYDYSMTHYEKALEKVTIICKYHGEFNQTPANHLSGKGCPVCAGIKRLSTEEFVRRASIKHKGKYLYTLVEYKTARLKVRIICNQHGEFSQTPDNHLNGVGCPKCAVTGFKSDRVGYFYIFLTPLWAGFGITNKPKERLPRHLLTFKRHGIIGRLYGLYKMSGEKALAVENAVKLNLPILNTGVEGFKTEAVSVEHLLLLLNFVRDMVNGDELVYNSISNGETEIMADEFEHASELEMMYNQIAIDAQSEASKPDLAYEEGEEPLECEECGCIIDQLRRRQTGSILCVDCKSWQDKVAKMRKIRGED